MARSLGLGLFVTTASFLLFPPVASFSFEAGLRVATSLAPQPAVEATADGPAAQRELADQMIRGEGRPIDVAGALAILEVLADRPDVSALVQLGDYYASGIGVALDGQMALLYYQRAADGGNTRALNKLGDLLRYGRGAFHKDPAAAVDVFEEAVAAGDNGARRKLADMAVRGEGQPADVSGGVATLEALAGAGDLGATLLLGDYAYWGIGSEVDSAKALHYYKQAADAGNIGGLNKLGDVLRTGFHDVQKDPMVAMTAYRAAEAAGDVGARRKLADMRLKGEGQPADIAGGVAVLETLAVDGDLASAILLGDNYARGAGVEQSAEKALSYYRQAAETGSAAGLNKLGDLFRDGLGSVPKDPAAAFAAFEAAAITGDVSGRRKTADMQITGEGTIQDVASGITTLEALAGSGDLSAMLLLADDYAGGIGVAVDGLKARQHYQSAADAGNLRAQIKLGDLLRNGLGDVAKDPKTAMVVYQLAAAVGDIGSYRKVADMQVRGEGLIAAPATGIAALERLGDDGDVASTILLGDYYFWGIGVDRDGSKAMSYYQTAADAGNTAGMVKLADLWRVGLGTVPKDSSASFELFQKAAMAGNVSAQRKLADMQVRGEAPSGDIAAGLASLENLAQAGDWAASIMLGDYYSRGVGVLADGPKAIGYYEQAPVSAVVLNRLGELYRSGTAGLDPKPELAAETFERAVALDDNLARRNLAGLYVRGTGVKRDIDHGLALLEAAVAGHDGAAALQLGILYANGSPLKPDYDMAKRYFNLASAAGNTGVLVREGALLANGPLAARYRAEGIELLRQAVELERPGARVELARLQFAGNIQGGRPEEGIDTLKPAVDANDPIAIRTLLAFYRDGGKDVEANPKAATALIDLKQSILGPETVAFERLLLAAGRGATQQNFAAIWEQFAQLGPKTGLQALVRLRGPATNAYVYVLQSKLASLGLYDGALNGLLTTSTIRSLLRVCDSANIRRACDFGPLSGTALVAFGPELLRQ